MALQKAPLRHLALSLALALALALLTLDPHTRPYLQMTKSAVVHIRFQPRADTTLLAAGDKEGHVSLWHADRPRDDPSDGVYLFRPHRQYVSGLTWCPSSSQAVISSSYDGTIKCLHLERQAFVTLYNSDHEISAFTAAAPRAATLWFGTNEGELGAIDARSSKLTEVVSVRHHRKVNTLSLDTGRDWLLASAGSDGLVQVYDVRKLQAALVSIELPKASQAAEFAPDGSSRLAVTCFDDMLRIYSLEKINDTASQGQKSSSKTAVPASLQPLTIKHHTQTGRWVVPFRATWTASADGVLVGSMKRSAEVYDAATGRRGTLQRSNQVSEPREPRRVTDGCSSVLRHARSKPRVLRSGQPERSRADDCHSLEECGSPQWPCGRGGDQLWSRPHLSGLADACGLRSRPGCKSWTKPPTLSDLLTSRPAPPFQLGLCQLLVSNWHLRREAGKRAAQGRLTLSLPRRPPPTCPHLWGVGVSNAQRVMEPYVCAHHARAHYMQKRQRSA